MFNKRIKARQIRFAQNYLKNPSLGSYLIKKTINPLDTVIEIGPGYGMLTKSLLRSAEKVIAIEKDRHYFEFLKEKMGDTKNLSLIYGDFLHVPIKEKNYKIFANIPFNITTRIVKRLVFIKNPPLDTYLFMQKEAAQRFCGKPLEYEFSVMTKPWFQYAIMHHFQKEDFSPLPNVHICLLHIHKKEIPLLPQEDMHLYKKFVAYGFEKQRKDLMNNMKELFTYEQWKRLAKTLHFHIHVPIRELSIEQWVGLFQFFREHVSDKKRALVEHIRL